MNANSSERHTFRMTSDEFYSGEDEMNGGCVACGEIQYGGCESDARRYPCDDCDTRAVYGFGELAIMGLIELTDEDGDEYEGGE